MSAQEPLGDLLAEVSATLERMATRRLRAVDPSLTYARLRFLGVVEGSRDVTQREVALQLGQSDAAVSRMLKQLTQEGLCTVAQGDGRGRVNKVTLTERGQRLFETASASMGDELAGALRGAGFPHDEYRDLTARLRDALVVAEAAERGGAPGEA